MMGLLSRKKTNTAQSSSQPAQAPPPISAPLPSSHQQPPSISTIHYYSAKKYPSSTGSGGAYAAQQQPSPPRSPVEAGYAHHGKQQSQSYRPQSSNSQNRAGGGGGGYGAGGGQDYGYGANGSSYAQERGYGDVEGKMGNLGINGGGNGNGAAGSADQMSVDTDMADGSNGQYGGNGGAYQQQSAVSRHHQQQQQQQQQGGGGGGHHSHASRQLARQTETTPQVVLSPTPSQSSSVSRKTSSRYSLTDFTFIRTLGTGSFGRVHLVRSQHNGRSYAIKVLSKERVVKMKQVEHTNSEREMLERVRHPFLVNLWGTFKDSKNLYMVMDFVAGGELFSLLRKSQRFPDPVAKFFAAEVALALDYLHSLDIIYRDLKPENILLGADGHVKITDFGFAKHVPDITWTLCGTPDYLAPEIVQSRGYNKSVDWYALGVLMFEMLAGYPPFFTEDSNPMRLYEKIISGKIRYPAYFTPEAKDLLKSLLTTDITKRFGNLANGSRDIFGHVWFQEVDWERLYRKEIPAPYVPKVEGDWDASNFDAYPEVDLSEYGSSGPDPHGHLFPLF